MHFFVLLISRHIFPRTPFPFFYRGFSLVTRPFIFHVFSPARSSSRFFPSSAPPSRLFSPSVFQSLISLILSPHIFSPEAISVANLPVNPSAVDFSTCSFLLHGFSLSPSFFLAFSIDLCLHLFISEFSRCSFFRIPYFPRDMIFAAASSYISSPVFPFAYRFVRPCGHRSAFARSRGGKGDRRSGRKREGRERAAQMKFNKISSPLVPRTRT